MNEEMMTNFEEFENTEVMELDDCETSGNGIVGKIVVGSAIALVGAGAALLWKNRKKLEERRIKKLEKKGYTVYKPDDVTDDSEEYFDEEVDDVE